MRILELHRAGLTISAIAERTGKDRKTVRKYLRQGVAVPGYKPRAARARVMDPYLSYVQERITAYPELTASITDAPTVRDILIHLGEPTAPPRIAPARGPPLWAADAEHDPTLDPALPPTPAYEFDQRLTW